MEGDRRKAVEGLKGDSMRKKEQFTGYNPTLKDLSRELRKNMTRHEKHLWYDFLKSYPVKWYRQRSIDRFIVDFYCSPAKLIIELDGSQHYTEDGIEFDAIRTDILEKYDLEVIRFSNIEIDRYFNDVCRAIDQKVKKLSKADWDSFETSWDFERHPLVTPPPR